MNPVGATGFNLQQSLKNYKVDGKGYVNLPVGLVGERISGFNRMHIVKFAWYKGYIIIGKKYAGKEVELWIDKPGDLHIQEV
jgi:hypothetical protein